MPGALKTIVTRVGHKHIQNYYCFKLFKRDLRQLEHAKVFT